VVGGEREIRKIFCVSQIGDVITGRIVVLGLVKGWLQESKVRSLSVTGTELFKSDCEIERSPVALNDFMK